MSQRSAPRPFPDAAAELRALRERAGLSQSELGDHCGYSKKTIQRWERGLDEPRPAVLECLRAMRAVRKPANGNGAPAFRFIDLFAGIGGLRLGFEAAGGECVFTSEWDEYAVDTYTENFGVDDGHPVAGDIVQVASGAIPEHDVLVAGFPCQPFSIAGVSKKNALGRPHGFACDTQGTLFFEVARILRHQKPSAFLLENVRNLVSHDGGRTFKTIKAVLTEELGYNIFWKIIDGRRWVPQHRERIYIVGFKEPTAFSWDDLEVPPLDAAPRLRDILHPEDGSEEPEPPFTDADGKVNRKYVLSEHLWSYLQQYAVKHKAKGNGFGFGLFGPDGVARTLSARYYKDGSEILIARKEGPPRRLTPRECSRLMGFDQPGRPFKIVVSDTQAYKQFGNSVIVPAVEAVAKLMRPHILGMPADATQFALPLAVRA